MCLAQERKQECHQVILDGARWCRQVLDQWVPLPHIFGDIEEMNPGNVYQPTHTYGQKRRRIMQSRLETQGFCWTHRQNCCWPIGPDDVQFDVSGLPCTDMSRAGAQLKRNGPTMSVYATHAKYTKHCKIPLLLLECTPDTRLDSFIHSFIHSVIHSFIHSRGLDIRSELCRDYVLFPRPLHPIDLGT